MSVPSVFYLKFCIHKIGIWFSNVVFFQKCRISIPKLVEFKSFFHISEYINGARNAPLPFSFKSIFSSDEITSK